MAKYRTKPVVVEAMQWDGTNLMDAGILEWNHAVRYNLGGGVPSVKVTRKGRAVYRKLMKEMWQ